MERPLHEPDEEAKDKIIVFASAKGGVGKTVLAVNTAVALASKGLSTCILDGNFQFGDVNLALDIEPKLTISDIAQDVKSMDSSMLGNYFNIHESGLKILAAPTKPEYADLITCDAVKSLCEMISAQNDYLLVDLSSGLTEHNLNFMELSHRILLITDLEMGALKNTKSMMRTLKALGLDEKVRVVVNRADMESVIKFKDVRGILEVENTCYVSNNFKVVSKSFNLGIPFVMGKPEERISKEVAGLAGMFCGEKAYPKRRGKKKAGLFDFFKR